MGEENLGACILNRAFEEDGFIASAFRTEPARMGEAKGETNVHSWAYNYLQEHLKGCQVSRAELMESRPYEPFLSTEMSHSADFHAHAFIPPKNQILKWKTFTKEVLTNMSWWKEEWEHRSHFKLEPHSRYQAIFATCEADLQRLFMQLLDVINFMVIEDIKVENWSKDKIFFWSGRLKSNWLEARQGGVPDASTYMLFFNSKTGRHQYCFSKLALEVKTVDALPGSEYKDAVNNAPIFSQVCGYMKANDLDIAVLTCLTYTWFVEQREDKYYVSDGIPYHGGVPGAPSDTPTLMECLYYVSRETCRRAVTERVRKLEELS